MYIRRSERRLIPRCTGHQSLRLLLFQSAWFGKPKLCFSNPTHQLVGFLHSFVLILYSILVGLLIPKINWKYSNVLYPSLEILCTNCEWLEMEIFCTTSLRRSWWQRQTLWRRRGRRKNKKLLLIKTKIKK